MRKVYTSLIIITITLSILSWSTDEQSGCGGGRGGSRKSAGPPSCYAGELPGQTTCASAGCHDDGTINTGLAKLRIDLGGAENDYTPNKNYTITVSLSKPGLTRGGFQIVALQDNKISKTPGVITLTDLVRTQTIDANNPHLGPCATQSKVWIEHTSNGIDNVIGDSIQWKFNWMAPDTNVGSITFYAAALDANKDLDNTGDSTYTTKKTIQGKPISGIQTVSKRNSIIFPNPANSFIQIKTDQIQSIAISNIYGEIVHRSHLPLSNAIDISNLKSGIYFIHDEKKLFLGKFLKE